MPCCFARPRPLVAARAAAHALCAFALLLTLPSASAQTWTPQVSGTAEDLADVHFLDAATGFAVGDGGLLLSTTDGGATWSAQTLGGGALDLEGIAFNAAGTVGLVVTDDGPAFRTTDGGATWALVTTGAADLRHVAWGGDDTVWAAGRESSAARSTDGGQSWDALTTGSADRTESIAATSESEAWVVNRSGGIRHTADGGATWSPQPSGTAADLDDIQMLDATTGYIAGSDGVVLKTSDGGSTWTNVSNSGAGGNGLFFLDAATGWAVGDAGQIWATADGGATWGLQPSGTSASFNRVHFVDAQRGWAVGDAGTIVAFVGAATNTEGSATAGSVTLSAPAPNPFAERAAFALTLGAAQAVRVEVFDVLGRRVRLLHGGPLGAGRHAFAVEAAGLPAGVYVVRAAGAAFVEARRLTLVR